VVAVRLAARALRRARIMRPRICVLVTGGDDADLDATLHALRGIPRADLVIVAAAAPGTAANAVGRAHEAADWRVRAVEATSWAGAADHVTSLRSRYVAALRGGDGADASWLGEAVASLGRGTPGLGVGAGLRLADPAAALFGRRVWRSVGEAASPTQALARALARTPDAVRFPNPPARLPVAAVHGMPDSRPDLSGWLAEQESAHGLFGHGTTLQATWATSALAGDAQRFLVDSERFDDDQWSALHGRVRALTLDAGEEGIAQLPVEARVRTALAATDRRGELEQFVVARRFEAGQYAVTAADGAAYAVLPVPDDLPVELRRLAPAETALRSSLRRLRWAGDALEAEVFACIAGVDLGVHEPDVTARLVGADRSVPLDVRLDSDREVTRWMGTHHVDHDRGVVRIRVPWADLAVPGRWQLEIAVTAAGIVRTGLVTGHDPGGSAELLSPRTREGVTVLVELSPELALVAESGCGHPTAVARETVLGALMIDHGRLTVGGKGVRRLELRGPIGMATGSTTGAGAPTLPGEVTEAGVSWPLVHDPWDLGPQPLPPGRYLLSARDGLGLSDDLAARLPEVLITVDHRVVVRHESGPEGSALVIALGPPLADDEVGPYCQRRLQEWYADPSHELDDDAVYLQAYTGQSATDSPLAIAEELARSRRDLALTWAVADGAARVSGSSTVLWRSRAWYSALARSRYVVTNIELESWFRRRPGQQVLQTFHGYPSKAMGIGLWRQKRFTRSRIEQQLDRTSRNWTLLLTPTPEMDVHYRENYRYDGEILAAGYPRDDVLVSAEAEKIRRATRSRLGIDEGAVAVLYAPTWRDDQATNFRSARPVDHLDVVAAAETLGPGHVLLLRGHRFMSSGPDRGSRVIDVTSYPEVNDLILAADAAVLDYSSMRFDFALTGKPMVFLVPDLEDYATAKRGFLYDFTPTAPGPLARSSAEVIAALRDLDGVRARHREAYEQFNATYNRFQDGGAARRTVERFIG
jgi:CDP-glycerol glycerophosphotransferase (TagB/SpsB family)